MIKIKLSFLLLLIPSLSLAQDPIFQPEGLVQLGTYTWAIPDNDVGGVPNAGIVVGEDATLVIDPGLGRENGEIILEVATALSDNTQFYIVSTHYHPEHTTGYLAFPDSTIYINSVTQENEFASDGERMIDFFAGRTPVMGELLADAERRMADITFADDYQLDLGGVRVDMRLVGPTHTAGDTGFFVVEDGVLFTGDVVMNRSFVAAGENSSISAWLSAFDIFEAMQPRIIVPAHGEIGPGSLIEFQRTLVTGIKNRTENLKAEGFSLEDTAEIVSAEFQGLFPEYPRARGIAALARSAWHEAE